LLYISFKDKRNNLVDGISLLSKEKMEMTDLDPDKNLSLSNVPSLFKKSGN